MQVVTDSDIDFQFLFSLEMSGLYLSIFSVFPFMTELVKVIVRIPNFYRNFL